MLGLRSEDSPAIKLRFVNQVDVSVDVIWITYAGDYHSFFTLKPKQFLDVDSYTKHVWIFKTTDTNLTLLANNRKYFVGTDYDKFRKGLENTRIQVNINYHSASKLKALCIRHVYRNMIKSCSDIKYLEIPACLKKDLIEFHHKQYPTTHTDERYFYSQIIRTCKFSREILDCRWA